MNFQTNTRVRYVHEESVHNLQAPEQIVPILTKLFNPQSVIDVGCGLGTFLHIFQKNGVSKIHGLDGSWVNKELLSRNIDISNFEEVNLEQTYKSNYKYDLAISLEVAEHISPDYASNFVETLTKLSDIIIFSAAPPYQGGQNHINEQWPDFWEELFFEKDYVMIDAIRPLIWDNKDIFFWYKQNMFIVVKRGLEKEIIDKVKTFYSPYNVTRRVHPDLFLHKAQKLEQALSELNAIYNGEKPIMTYFKMIKALFWRKYDKIKLFLKK